MNKMPRTTTATPRRNGVTLQITRGDLQTLITALNGVSVSDPSAARLYNTLVGALRASREMA